MTIQLEFVISTRGGSRWGGGGGTRGTQFEKNEKEYKYNFHFFGDKFLISSFICISIYNDDHRRIQLTGVEWFN